MPFWAVTDHLASRNLFWHPSEHSSNATRHIPATDPQIIPSSEIPQEALSKQCLPDKLAYFVYLVRTGEKVIISHSQLQHLTGALISQLVSDPGNQGLLQDICTNIFDIVLVGSSYPPVAAVPLGVPHVLHASGVREFAMSAFLVNATPCSLQANPLVFPDAKSGEDERLAIVGTTNISKEKILPMLMSLESLRFQMVMAAQGRDVHLLPLIIRRLEHALASMNEEYAADQNEDGSPSTVRVDDRRVISAVDAPLQAALGVKPYLPASAVSEKLFWRLDAFQAMNYLCYDYFAIGDAIFYHYLSREQGREHTLTYVLVLVRRIWTTDGTILPNVFIDAEILVRSSQVADSLHVLLTNTIVTLPVSDPTICKGIQRIPITLVMGSTMQEDTAEKTVSFHVPLQGRPENMLQADPCCTETYIQTCHVLGAVSLSSLTRSAKIFQDAMECTVPQDKGVAIEQEKVQMQALIIQDMDWVDAENLDNVAESNGRSTGLKTNVPSPSSSITEESANNVHEPTLKRPPSSTTKGLYLQALDTVPDGTEQSGYQLVLKTSNEIHPLACTICATRFDAHDLFVGDISSVHSPSVQRLLEVNTNAANISVPVVQPTTETALLLNSHDQIYQCPQCFNIYCKMCKAEMLNSSSDNFLYQTNNMMTSIHKGLSGFENLNTPCWRCNLPDDVTVGISADSTNPLVAFYLRRFVGFLDPAASAMLDPQQLATQHTEYFSKYISECVPGMEPSIALPMAINQFIHEFDALRSSWHFAYSLVEWRYAPHCVSPGLEADVVEERIQARTRSLTSLLDLIASIRYSPDIDIDVDDTNVDADAAQPVSPSSPSPEDKQVLLSMDLRFAVKDQDPVSYNLRYEVLPPAGLYENSNFFMLSAFPYIWKSCNTGANLFFCGAPFYTRLYIEFYQGLDMNRVRQLPYDTPQDTVVRRRTRGKTAGMAALASGTDGLSATATPGTGRRRTSATTATGAAIAVNNSIIQDQPVKLDPAGLPLKTEDKMSTADDSGKKIQTRRAKTAARNSRQVTGSSMFFQSDVNGLPVPTQGHSINHQPPSISGGSPTLPMGQMPGHMQVIPGGGLSSFGNGSVHRLNVDGMYSDKTSVVFPTSYIENYLMPSLTQEALSSWIGKTIRPFFVPTDSKVMHISGALVPEIDNAGEILIDAEAKPLPIGADKGEELLIKSTAVTPTKLESSIVQRQQKAPFTLPSSIHINRLKHEISEGCLFYTGFDKTLRYLLEEYSECDSNTWIDEDLKTLLSTINQSDIPITQNMPILQKLKDMLATNVDDTPDAATILKHLTKDILPEFMETRYQLETHFDYGHTSENVRTLQTINALVNVAAFAGISSCEDEELLAQIKRERNEAQADQEEEAKEIISLVDKEKAKRLIGQQAILAVNELTSNPSCYNLKPPADYTHLQGKSEYIMAPDEAATSSSKATIAVKKNAQRATLVDTLTRKIACLNQLISASQRRDNAPSDSLNSKACSSVSVISTDDSVNQTFPRSATMRYLILEKREMELRSYLETLASVEARTRKSMEELLTSIDAVRRGMIELRRKQAGLVDELIDFVKEKYRLDNTISEVAGVIADIAVVLSTIRIPVTDRQLPSDTQCLKQLKQKLSDDLLNLLK